MREDEDDELFVGYLPTPPRTLRFVRWLIAAMLVLVPSAAALTVLGSGDTGHGIQPLASTEGDGLVGLLAARPYGVLWVPGPAGPEGVLLVSQGKFGIAPSVAAMDDTVVRVQGLVLSRDGQRMIEIGPAPEPAELPEAELVRLRARAAREEGHVTITGEIVDEKCWLGRMRPGGSRTHRACAQLCVRGGIPPVLVGHDESGGVVEAVLVDAVGEPSTAWIVPFVALPVRVSGELVRDGSLTYLRTSAADIEPL